MTVRLGHGPLARGLVSIVLARASPIPVIVLHQIGQGRRWARGKGEDRFSIIGSQAR